MKTLKKYLVNYRMKVIIFCIVFLFLFIFIVLNYAFQKSKDLLIEKEADVIAQFLDKNELALIDAMDSIRKLSAASSTNKQIVEELDKAYFGSAYSSENVNRIKNMEDMLLFYRNIFFDYRMHYIIVGANGTIYSVVDGIDNSAHFSQKLVSDIENQSWYTDFLKSGEISRWISPCFYNKKGELDIEKTDVRDEEYILFVRKIKKYVNQKELGISIISFPVENFNRIISPYSGAELAIYNESGQRIYLNGKDLFFSEISEEDFNKTKGQKKGFFYSEKSTISYLVNYVNLDGSDWTLMNATPVHALTAAVDQLYSSVTVLVSLITLSALAVCFFMYLFITAPLNRVIQKVRSVNIGGSTISDIKIRKREIYGIKEAEEEINYMVDYIEILSEQAIKQREIEEGLKYEMLRAQLNPHFLFNTLNTIKWSAMISGAGNIAEMITSVGVLLENTMNRKAEEVTLKEEIRVAKAWVEIKNWALKDWIKLEVKIPDLLQEFMVIRFFLQPIIENAVLHGIDNRDKGEILITAEETETSVAIFVKDNGVGIKSDVLEEILKNLDEKSKKQHMTGIGLTSINELMKIRYGKEYGLIITSVYGEGTTVKAIFPKDMKRWVYVKSDDC